MPQHCMSTESFINLLKKRHSGRTYNSSRKVSVADLHTLVNAAQLSPSCYNEQPWFFLITEKSITPDSYNKILDCLADANKKWAQDAPVLLVSCHSTKFAKNQKPNRWGPYDTGSAAYAMALVATEMGLMAHQMGGFDEVKLQKSLEIPSDVIPMAVMAVGYEAETDEVPFKDRKAQNQNFFWGQWGTPFNQAK